ncbi:MAG: T9SS type A sorting domain-containing protein [Bacteroidales bacterium]|nr:T9SS type A sorting domain-containing protein [Bacteroidales bacterium]
MKTILSWFLMLFLFQASAFSLPASNPPEKKNEDIFIIHSWFFGNSIPAATPLQTIDATYGQLSGGMLQYHSALTGYPFNPFSPNWRKASLERKDSPTPINYQPSANNHITYEASGMTGILVKQPFAGNGGENTLVFHLPSTGFRELVFRFAAKDEGAADALKIDYSVAAGNPVWISTGLITTVFPLDSEYLLYEISFTDSATQSPPPPPGHGLGDDQISMGTFMLVNNNPDFSIRIRFLGSNMMADENKNVVFNNFSLEGKVAANAYHVINLTEGWSGISSYIIPTNPELDRIFYPARNQLVILQNFSGFYWPSTGVNTLNQWNYQTGYSVKVENPSQIVIGGEMQETLTLTLNAGWNYLPVMTECPQPVAELFAEVSNNLIVVKEIAGNQVYWPSMGINTLQVIAPGNAYLTLLQNQATIEFPECDGQSDGIAFTEKFSPETADVLQTFQIHPTPIMHTIAIPTTSAIHLQPGDAIIATGADSKYYGAVTWQHESTAITLFGDDPTTTEKDGLIEFEEFNLRLKRESTDKILHLNVTYHPDLPQNSGFFVTNGLSAIASMEASNVAPIQPLTGRQVHIVPNPAGNEIVLSVEEIIFESGHLVIRGIDGNYRAEIQLHHNPSTIDVSKLKAGVYLLQVNVNGEVINTRMVKL